MEVTKEKEDLKEVGKEYQRNLKGLLFFFYFIYMAGYHKPSVPFCPLTSCYSQKSSIFITGNKILDLLILMSTNSTLIELHSNFKSIRMKFFIKKYA